jgi:hypothetical protein
VTAKRTGGEENLKEQKEDGCNREEKREGDMRT